MADTLTIFMGSFFPDGWLMPRDDHALSCAPGRIDWDNLLLLEHGGQARRKFRLMIGFRQSPKRNVGCIHQIGVAACKDSGDPRPLLAYDTGQLEPGHVRHRM